MLGDREHPISFRFEPVERGEHVEVKVRAGNRGSGRALVGTLFLRREEWVALRDLLGQSRPDEALNVALREAIPVDMQHEPTLDYHGRLIVAGARVVHIDATPFDVEAPPGCPA